MTRSVSVVRAVVAVAVAVAVGLRNGAKENKSRADRKLQMEIVLVLIHVN